MQCQKMLGPPPMLIELSLIEPFRDASGDTAILRELLFEGALEKAGAEGPSQAIA